MQSLLVTRLNEQIAERDDDMVFDVVTQIALVSGAITLSPSEISSPELLELVFCESLQKSGDICEVEIDRIGILRHPVIDEPMPTVSG